MSTPAKDRYRSVTSGRDAGGAAPQLLSVPDVARRLAISERHVARLVSSGKIASIKIGRRTLVAEADLAAFVEGVGR